MPFTTLLAVLGFSALWIFGIFSSLRLCELWYNGKCSNAWTNRIWQDTVAFYWKGVPKLADATVKKNSDITFFAHMQDEKHSYPFGLWFPTFMASSVAGTIPVLLVSVILVDFLRLSLLMLWLRIGKDTPEKQLISKRLEYFADMRLMQKIEREKNNTAEYLKKREVIVQKRKEKLEAELAQPTKQELIQQATGSIEVDLLQLKGQLDEILQEDWSEEDNGKSLDFPAKQKTKIG